jgi:hypothetical protein
LNHPGIPAEVKTGTGFGPPIFRKEIFMASGCLYRRKKKLTDGTLIEVGPYWMKYYRNGSPFSESTHTESKTEAQRELNKRMGDVARGVPVTSKVGRVKFKELIENVCNEYQANGRRSIYDLRIRCNKHLLPFFGERRASTITPADINRYVVKRQTEEEAANGTINRELAVLQRAYTLAVQSGLLHGKPHAQKLEGKQRPHRLLRARAVRGNTSAFACLRQARGGSRLHHRLANAE